MQINSSLTALGNLLAQITADNAGWSVITEAIAAVQSTSAVTPDADGRNTVVVIGADGYSDQVSFTYTRRGLGDSVNPAPTAISLQGTESAADVAVLVAKALGLVQSEVSFNAAFINADGTITLPAAAADGSVTGSVQIVSATGSLLYADGSTLSLNVNFPSQVVTPPAQPTLAALTTVTALSGFSAAAAPTTPPATDGTSSTGTTGTDGQATGGTTPPAADGTTGGTTPPAADGTGSTTTTGTDGQATGGTTPAADGTTSTPSAATDGTAADGTTAPAADGTTTAPAASDGATPAAPAADGQGSQAAAS
jgi:hypothetical protein